MKYVGHADRGDLIPSVDSIGIYTKRYRVMYPINFKVTEIAWGTMSLEWYIAPRNH